MRHSPFVEVLAQSNFVVETKCLAGHNKMRSGELMVFWVKIKIISDKCNAVIAKKETITLFLLCT